MLDDLSFYRPIVLGLMALDLAIFSISLAALMAHDKGRRRWPWALLALVSGPLAPFIVHRLPALEKARRNRRQHPRFHPLAALFAALIALLVVGISTFTGYKLLEDQGEDLQYFIVAGLIVGGLLAGFVAAYFARRVAYFETLFAQVFLLAMAAALGPRLDTAFSYGTTPVFFLVLGISAVLIFDVVRILGGSVGFMLSGDGHFSWHFSYESWIGRRFLMAKRRSSFISVITVISIGGVAVGVWAMLVVLSVMSGFSGDLRSKILGANAHLIVLRYGTDFTEYRQAEEKIRKLKGINGTSPFVLNEVMVSSEINMSGAVIKGVDAKTAGQVSDLAKNMIQGSLENLDHPERIEGIDNDPLKNDAQGGLEDNKKPPASSTKKAAPKKPDDDDDMADLAALGAAPEPDSKEENAGANVLPGVIIGQELARNLKVFVGDSVNIVSPVGELGPTGPIPKARAFASLAFFIRACTSTTPSLFTFNWPRPRIFSAPRAR